MLVTPKALSTHLNSNNLKDNTMGNQQETKAQWILYLFT